MPHVITYTDPAGAVHVPPASRSWRARRRALAWMAALAVLTGAAGVASATSPGGEPAQLGTGAATVVPPAPRPEPVAITQLMLPPPAAEDGTCTHPTGCVVNGQSGGFLPDGKHVSAMLEYTGSPADSPYAGRQIVLLKTDGSTFPNGEPWKCLTCGTPEENRRGMYELPHEPYPQPFPDGRRILANTNVVDCSPYPLSSASCQPQKIRIFPVYWRTSTDPAAATGSMRELRLSPDGVHLAWNRIKLGPLTGDVEPTRPGSVDVDQYGYFGRLRFASAPADGTPRVPRYEIENVSVLAREDLTDEPFTVDPQNPAELRFAPKASIGEFRGFNGDGTGVLGMCFYESNNVDICETGLSDPAAFSARRTSDPAYIDPIAVSPDNEWAVALESRGAAPGPVNVEGPTMDRHMYLAGLPGVPSLNQLVRGAGGAVTSGYRDGEWRFFQPYLYDRQADRPGYAAQQLNACPSGQDAGGPNSVCDPHWGTRADPRWSPDGTRVVYYQSLVPEIECPNPLACPGPGPDGHRIRVMLAELTSRVPKKVAVDETSDLVAWGTPYQPGDADVRRTHVPAGDYTLKGRHSGYADVVLVADPVLERLTSVATTYHGFSDDGLHVLDGTEVVVNPGNALGPTTWHSGLRVTGAATGTRTTPPGGFTLSTANSFTFQLLYAGYMVTALDGATYVPPLPTR